MKKKFSVFCALVCTLMLTACSSAKTYTTDDYVNVKVSGVNGKATASVSVDRDFYDVIDADLFDGEGTDLELAQMEIVIYDSVEFSTEDKTKKLSNGDTITVVLTADNERLEQYGVKFDQKEYVYTVEGLQDPVTLDVWSDLMVTYSGIAPYGQAEFVYTGSNEFIKENVRYYSSGAYGLSNGDTLTVEMNCPQQKLDENLYVVTEETKDFTVSGLAEYLADPKGFDMSEIDAVLKERAQAVADKSSYCEDSFTYSAKLVPGGNLSEKWTVQSIDLQPEKTVFLYSKDENNIYATFWNMNITAEKTYTDEWVSKPDGYALNEVATFDVYIVSYMTGILNDNGTLNTDSAQIGDEAYGNTIFGNYIGMSLDEIADEFIGGYSGYTVVE